MGQLIHMFPLQSVSVLLPAQELHGMAGWGAALSQALLDWGKHVGNSEKHRYLAGVRPIRSLVNVGSGVADLFLLPYQQYYRKKGRFSRGIIKGASSLARAVSEETVAATAAMAKTVTRALQAVDGVLQPDHILSHARRRRTQATAAEGVKRAQRVTHGKRNKIGKRGKHRGNREEGQPSSLQEGIEQG